MQPTALELRYEGNFVGHNPLLGWEEFTYRGKRYIVLQEFVYEV